MTRTEHAALLFVLIFALWLLAQLAAAQPGKHVQQLGQACWLESTWRESDCAGIVYALGRRAARARIGIGDMAERYSLDKPTPRAARARQLPATLHGRELQRWARLIGVVRLALARGVPDPCPRATHFGGMALEPDRLRAEAAVAAGRWRPVRCRKPTANAFFREARQ